MANINWSDRFSKRWTVLWKDVDDSLLARTTVARAWYEARYPDLHDYTRMYFYGFEVVK